MIAISPRRSQAFSPSLEGATRPRLWWVAAPVVFATVASLVVAACGGLVGCGQFCDEGFWRTAEAADVQKELDRGADILADHQNGNPRAPLVWAAQYGNREVMLLLLDHSEDREDGQELRAALMGEAVRYSPREALELFFEREVHFYADEKYPLLHNALSSSNRPAVELLLEHGADADINAVNNDWKTPLHWAVASPGAEPAGIELLAQRGADIQARTRKGETPLHLAAGRAEPEIIETLLELGGDADLASQTDPGDTPLHLAVESDDPRVIALLMEWGADVTATNDLGWTPLHTAAEYGPQPDVLQVLIDRGAVVDAQNHNGRTPLMLAACCAVRNPEVLRTDGSDALAERNAEIIELLLANGADPSVRSHDGFTACEYAGLASEPFFKKVRPLVCP